MLAVFKISLLAVLLPIATLAAHVGRDHAELARRVDGNVDLHARQWGSWLEASKLSFYDGQTGNAGSCGEMLTNDQPFVAVTMSMMDKGRYCNKWITIRWRGKTVRGIIKDSCPSSSCLATGLDLSPSLFSQLAPQSQGLIFGAEWRVEGSGGDAPAPPPAPRPTRRPDPPYVPPPRPTPTRRPVVVDPPRPTPTRSSTRSTTRSSTSRSTTRTRTRTTTTTSEEETASAANVRGSNTSSDAPAPTVNLAVGPAAGLAQPASAVDIPAGGFSNLLSLNQAFVQAVAVVASTKKSA